MQITDFRNKSFLKNLQGKSDAMLLVVALDLSNKGDTI